MMFSLRRNHRLRCNDGYEILGTEETETEFTNRCPFSILRIHYKLGLHGGHLSPGTNPRKGIARRSIEEEVSNRIRARSDTGNGFVHNHREIVRGINIEAINMETILKARNKALRSNTLPFVNRRHEVTHVGLGLE